MTIKWLNQGETENDNVDRGRGRVRQSKKAGVRGGDTRGQRQTDREKRRGVKPRSVSA